MKHDGNLGDDERTANDARVQYDDDVWLGGLNYFVRGIRIKEDLHEQSIRLTPQQALSLLAWLSAEQEELEDLAEKNYPWNLMRE